MKTDGKIIKYSQNAVNVSVAKGKKTITAVIFKAWLKKNFLFIAAKCIDKAHFLILDWKAFSNLRRPKPSTGAWCLPAGGIQFRKSIFVFCESDSVGCIRTYVRRKAELFVCDDEDFSAAAGP